MRLRCKSSRFLVAVAESMGLAKPRDHSVLRPASKGRNTLHEELVL